MNSLTPDHVADRVIGSHVPYAPIYKNVSMLQVARGEQELIVPGTRLVENGRIAVLLAMQQIAPDAFLQKRWPQLLSENGLPVSPEMFERDEIEMCILDTLSVTSPDRIAIDDQLLSTVSRATQSVMATNQSSDSQLYFSGGINVIEAALATRVLGVLNEREDRCMYPVLSGDDNAKLGPLMTESIRRSARRLGFEDMLFEDCDPTPIQTSAYDRKISTIGFGIFNLLNRLFERFRRGA